MEADKKEVCLRIREAVYVGAHRRLTVRLGWPISHPPNGVTRMTRNAVTNAMQLNRRRRCVLPTPREPAIPQCDWALPPPIAVGVHPTPPAGHGGGLD